MARYAIGVEYKGTHFSGWQRQKNGLGVQAAIEDALSEVANHPVSIVCAGRTDAGVHGIGQVAHFDSDSKRPLHAWLLGANTKLDRDVRIAWVRLVDEEFNARFSAFARSYRYVIHQREVRSAILHEQCTWYRKKLDIPRMQQAANYLAGTHDFSAFRASECQAHSPVRTLEYAQWSRQGDFVYLDIKANAFLHHMVRNVVGTLMKVGVGEREPEWVDEVLKSKDRAEAGVTAPAAGLYFVSVYYPEKWQLPSVNTPPSFHGI